MYKQIWKFDNDPKPGIGANSSFTLQYMNKQGRVIKVINLSAKSADRVRDRDGYSEVVLGPEPA